MNYLKKMYSFRNILWELSVNDFKNKFAGSYLGVIWAFAQPVVVVSIYWLIFEKGLKAQPMDNFSYLLWLIAGICPWFYINEALNSASNSMVEYSYIVKKVKFQMELIPLIKVISAMFVHAFFVFLVLAIYMANGIKLTLCTVQVLYYSFAAMMLAVGISYIISAVNVFFRDTAQIVAILLQYGMWLVAIMIGENQYPEILSKFMKFNPVYYLVEGYRDSLIRGRWFWERPVLSVYFWLVVILVFLIGIRLFRKLKIHFADVL